MPRGKRTAAAVAATSSQAPQKKAKHVKAPPRGSSISAAEVDNSSVTGRAGATDNDAESDVTRETATTTEDASVTLKQLEAVMQRTEKKDNFAKKFEKKIREEESRLFHLMEEHEKQRKAETDKFRSRFSAVIATALASPGVKPTTAQHSQIKADLSPENHPLYSRSQTLLENCGTLVKEWDKLVEYASGVEELPAVKEVWERDYAEAQRVIGLGRHASEVEIEKLLVYEGNRKGNSSRKMREKQRELEKDGHLQEMLKMGREGSEDKSSQAEKEARGWGYVAHQAKRGFEALAAVLPDE